MTTIATDGVTIAADGRSTSDNIVISDEVEKLRRLKDGRILGGCGTYHEVDAVARWLDEGGDKPEVEDGFAALLLGPHCVELLEKGMARQRCVLPAAIGSGGDMALGAMLAGFAPRAAVELATRRDVYSGGNIVSMTCETTSELFKRKRPKGPLSLAP